MRRGKIVGVFALFLLPILAWVGVAGAQSFRSGDNTRVPAGEVVDSSLWAAGRSVDIAGEIHGDVFCAGQNVSISGKVTGDVICAGQTVTVSGVVEGDVRLAGQTVTVGGEIKGNASVAAQTFSLEGRGNVGGDASVAGDGLTLNGSVGRDLAITGSTVTITNTVGRDLTATTENLSLSKESRVAGQLSYTSHNEANIAEGATIVGLTTRHEPPQENKRMWGTLFAPSLGMAFFMLLSLLIVALALALLFPGVLHETTSKALAQPGKTFLTGFVATIAAPVLIIGLMVTVVGIPLGLLLFGMWILILAVSGPTFGYFVGRLLLKEQRNPIIIMLAGSTLTLILHLVPIIGFFTFLAALWLGSGMLLREFLRRTPKPAYDVHKSSKSK